MELIKTSVTNDHLKVLAKMSLHNLVKAVVDIEKGIMVIDAELHSDEEAELLNNGSSQVNLWGINLYPEKTGQDYIEFDSMINLRPSANNRSRYVEAEKIRQQITVIVTKLIRHD